MQSNLYHEDSNKVKIFQASYEEMLCRIRIKMSMDLTLQHQLVSFHSQSDSCQVADLYGVYGVACRVALRVYISTTPKEGKEQIWSFHQLRIFNHPDLLCQCTDKIVDLEYLET